MAKERQDFVPRYAILDNARRIDTDLSRGNDGKSSRLLCSSMRGSLSHFPDLYEGLLQWHLACPNYQKCTN